MIFDRVREILADQLEVDPDSITRDTDIIDDLAADSLDLAELLAMLEEEYDLVMTDEAVHGVRTVGDVADMVESLTK